ncbi:MAG: hypothetical protein OXF64_07635, partial [bacterium]|nr:hypothetical protein [bacterium]
MNFRALVDAFGTPIAVDVPGEAGLYYRCAAGNRLQGGNIQMKKLITLLALLTLAASMCFAGSITGYVTDEKCA